MSAVPLGLVLFLGTVLGPLALLAILQGLTEFLPVSSSGHLVLAEHALNFQSAGVVVEVALHVGTLLAVFVVYRRDLLALIRGLVRGEWREPAAILVATLPAVALVLALGDRLDAAFHDPTVAAAGLIGTAAILCLGELARRRGARANPGPSTRETPGFAGAFWIGCAQAVAILPGVSRSGSTIAAGLWLGLRPERAARFSFLMAVPAILGAAVVSLPDALKADGSPGLGTLLGPTLLSALVGWLALRLLLGFLGRGAFVWFALYCALLGAGYLIFA